MVYDKGVSFRFLHKVDGQPLKYVKVCTKDDKIVPWDEVKEVMRLLKTSM